LARQRDIEADFIIGFAKKTLDWPLLEKAVDKKIEDQQEFVRWWIDSVRKKGGRGGFKSDNAVLRYRSVEDAEELTGITQQKVSKWNERLRDVPAYRERLFGVAWKAAMAEKVDNTPRTTGTGENEWYTPAPIVELVRAVLGGIDLDPASCELAQQTVRASRYFSKRDNGLLQDWMGRVFLNPPYSKLLMPSFLKKMVFEVTAGHVTAGIMLTHAYSDTAWFHLALGACSAVCFTKGRIKFIDKNGKEVKSPIQGQALFCFGPDTVVERFADVFSKVGSILYRRR
jgi:phage N-6-adenine-methyltransferase